VLKNPDSKVVTQAKQNSAYQPTEPEKQQDKLKLIEVYSFLAPKFVNAMNNHKDIGKREQTIMECIDGTAYD